ncbi:MAG: CHAD domain-containing protein [Planctomycetia bacterium]|nr:CHAD domain-containing protein [Planctomycetia bacterium]
MNDKLVLDVDTQNSNLVEFAKSIILNRFTTMYSHIDGVIENVEIEPIHQFRVASRRFRAVLKVFSTLFPHRNTENIISEIEAIVALAGKARDLDVQVLFLEKYILTIPPQERKGVALFLLKRRVLREQLQADIIDQFQSFKYSSVFDDFHILINSDNVGPDFSYSRITGDKTPSDLKLPVQAVRVVHKAVSDCVRKLQIISERFSETVDYKMIHKMRIALKNLRYTIEIPAEFLRDKYSQHLINIKYLQDCLGEIHDEDVQIRILRKRIRLEFKTSDQFQLIERAIKDDSIRVDMIASFYTKAIHHDCCGLIHLLRDLIDIRYKNYKLFTQYWKKMLEDNFFHSIRTILVN